VSDKAKKPWTRWLGILSLIIFVALVGWDFSAIHSTAKAAIVAVIIAAIFVIVTKLANIEPGWPNN
jgi:di/tricarboxylate transporter